MRASRLAKHDLPAHPRFKGFEAFAARDIFPRLASMEDGRRRVVRRAKLISLAAAAVLAVLAALASLDIIGLFGLVALGILSALAAAFAAGWPLMSFASNVDAFLLGKACEHLKLRHTGDAPGLPLERFLEARLLPRHGQWKLEDGIECDEPGLSFAAAEATLTRSGTDSEGRAESETAWRGLLVAVPAPRPFAGRTLVIRARGAIEQFIDLRAAERIELGLPELEQGLEIRTTDAAEARAVLTERVMRRIVELARRLGPDAPALGLCEDSVLLAIESAKNRFRSGSVFQPFDTAEALGDLLADVALLLELAEALSDALRSSRLTRPA